MYIAANDYSTSHKKVNIYARCTPISVPIVRPYPYQWDARTRTRSMPAATVTYAHSRLHATPLILYYSIKITVSSSQCDPHLFQTLLTL